MNESTPACDLLVAMQRLQFNRAAKLDSRLFIAQLATLVVALASLFLPYEHWASLLGVCSVALASATLLLLYQSRRKRALAEKARRATVLVGGLGMSLSEGELRRLAALANATPDEMVKWSDPDYFATKEPPGVKRATDMAEENAFWSYNLYHASQLTMYLWSLVPAAIAAAGFLLTLSLLPGSTNSQQVKVFSTIASSLILLELLTRTAQYGVAAGETEAVYERLANIRSAGYSKDDLMLALMDYNAAVESAPLMAWGVHRRNKERLETLWHQHYK